MEDAPHYPEAAQVADNLIASQIKVMRDEVMRGLDRQDRYNDKLDLRLESMVTRSEFRAEIGRVDAERAAVSKDVASVSENVSKEIASVSKSVSDGFAEIASQSKAKASNGRWFTGIMLTAAGIVSGLVFNIISTVAK